MTVRQMKEAIHLHDLKMKLTVEQSFAAKRAAKLAKAVKFDAYMKSVEELVKECNLRFKDLSGPPGIADVDVEQIKVLAE